MLFESGEHSEGYTKINLKQAVSLLIVYGSGLVAQFSDHNTCRTKCRHLVTW